MDSQYIIYVAAHAFCLGVMIIIGLYLLLSKQSAFFREVEPNQLVRRAAGWNALLWAAYYAPVLIGVAFQDSTHGSILPAASSMYVLLLVPGIAVFFLHLVEMDRTIKTFLICSLFIPLILIVWHHLEPKASWVIYTNLVYWTVYSIGFILWFIRLERLYRKRLKDLYADTEGHDIRWINNLMLFFLAYLVLYIAANHISDYTPYYIMYGCSIGLWCYLTYQVDRRECVYHFWQGVRYAPGLEEEQSDDSMTETVDAGIPSDRPRDLSWVGEKIKKACEEEQMFLRQGLNVDMLASHIGTNRSYISQYLSSENMTYYGYINALRVQYAKELMRQNDSMTLTDIAYQSGFKSVVTFRRAFYEIEKCTPSEYTKRYS